MRILVAAAFLLAASAAAAAEPAGRAAVPTCPGRGYIPYAYPAFGSCPCDEDGCFSPGRYYACCGNADPGYKKAFWRRWLRAHFRGGSMLDTAPCHCIYPAGRTVAVPLDTPEISAVKDTDGTAASIPPESETTDERRQAGAEPDRESLDALRQES